MDIVTAARKKPPPPPKPRRVDAPFLEELDRFAAADPRWRDVLERAAARLSPAARCTFGVALSGLAAGPAPWPLSFDFDPDDDEGVEREMRQMDPKTVSALRLLTAERLYLPPHEVAAVIGLVTATHRRLRVAKARP